MLVVVASRFDGEATALAARWAKDGAALLRCEDLSTAGWRYLPDDPRSSTAVVSGELVPISSIRGVVTRRPSIFEAEIACVATMDREFVAAEMNAFLLCWLAALRCPVFNPPTPGCLSGPNWSPAEWVRAAARTGICVRPFRTDIPACPESRIEQSGIGPAEPAGEAIEVTLVGDCCFGAPDGEVAAYARNLAAAAGVRLLSVRFDMGTGPPVFLDANLFPKLTQDEVADALREELLSGKVQGPGRGGRKP